MTTVKVTSHGTELHVDDLYGDRRPIVLVGLMGVGKSTVGKRLAQRLGLPFVDADNAIEEAAGMSIAEIFAQFGEPYFRDGERRVIQRLIDGRPKVIATGGMATMVESGIDCIDHIDRRLTLDGLQMLHEKNKGLNKKRILQE